MRFRLMRDQDEGQSAVLMLCLVSAFLALESEVGGVCFDWRSLQIGVMRLCSAAFSCRDRGEGAAVYRAGLRTWSEPEGAPA